AALAARPDEGPDWEGISGEDGIGHSLVIVVIELDQEFDLVALFWGDVGHRGIQQAREVGVRVVLDARTENDADHGLRVLVTAVGPIVDLTLRVRTPIQAFTGGK